MIIDTKQIISMTEANQNFSKASKTADLYGKAVIVKNNKPKYVLIDVNSSSYIELSEEEKIEIIAKRMLNKHILAFKELAK
jgi:antitoxin Phd